MGKYKNIRWLNAEHTLVDAFHEDGSYVSAPAGNILFGMIVGSITEGNPAEEYVAQPGEEGE
ncbi:MAG: hypothetical protein AB7E51_06735 [Pseudodesulfovibrio sp.]|uniref:hypothetical protein n=1 Tax=Pseudodesulfovibrio sp. TaxID=2035812 RepID=UPI003D1436A6